jgi:hypothetical protein
MHFSPLPWVIFSLPHHPPLFDYPNNI